MATGIERVESANVDTRDELIRARQMMLDALALLDEFSISPAAATLDLAIHHLDGEIAE